MPRLAPVIRMEGTVCMTIPSVDHGSLMGNRKKHPPNGRVLATLKDMNQSGLWKDDLVDHVNDPVGGRHIGFDHLSIVHFHTPLAGFDVYFLA